MKINKIIFFITLVAYLFSFNVSDAIGKNGMVVSSKKPASEIGIEILKNGGNAIDAAIAVGFALSVTHPSAGNIGGGGFMLIRFSDGTTTSIDFREVAPLYSHKNMFLDDKGNVVDGLSWNSPLSTGVPGTVAGYGYAHQKYGSMDWESLVMPSVLLSKNGFYLDHHNVSILNSEKYKNKLSKDFYSKDIFTKNDSFKINEKFIQTDLSKTLLRIAKFGYKEFYTGITAQNIIKCMKRTGGIITYEDLVQYKPIERKPILFEYKDYKIHSMPLSSSGGITLANILNQLENIKLDSLGFQSADYVHYLVEAEKRAYSDRAFYLGDIDYNKIPIKKLISDEYAIKRFNTIQADLSTPSDELDNNISIKFNESEETTHYSIVDKFGNAVSVTYTLNGWFGNGIVVDDSGFLLNNEMDDFSIKPGHPNAYGLVGNEANSIYPKKRMLSSMTPTIVENTDGSLYMVLGSPGGSTIITTIAQIIINVIDFNMSIDQAVEMKRFHHQWLPPFIQIEKHSLSMDTIKLLKSKGHDLVYRSNVGIGEANCILYDGNLYYGSADSRRDSHAIGY